MKPYPIPGTVEYLAISPPETIAVAHRVVTSKRRSAATLFRISKLRDAALAADAKAMAITSKHAGNPAWCHAARAAADAAWALRKAVDRL